MKFVYVTVLTLLLLAHARADDAEKLGLKCPVGSKFMKERIDAKKFEKICLGSSFSLPETSERRRDVPDLAGTSQDTV